MSGRVRMLPTAGGKAIVQQQVETPCLQSFRTDAEDAYLVDTSQTALAFHPSASLPALLAAARSRHKALFDTVSMWGRVPGSFTEVTAQELAVLLWQGVDEVHQILAAMEDPCQRAVVPDDEAGDAS